MTSYIDKLLFTTQSWTELKWKGKTVWVHLTKAFLQITKKIYMYVRERENEFVRRLIKNYEV